MSPPVQTADKSASLPPVDHLVWGGHHLLHEIERIEALIGARATPGGRHPGEGTHNAIIGLGSAMYLEIIAPDLSQPPPSVVRWMGLDGLTEPGLIAWAARSADLERQAAEASRQDLHLGEVRACRRERADGRTLSWRFTYPGRLVGDGLVPFLIDWGDGPHPADSAPSGVRLVELRAEHPEPEAIARMLGILGVELPVTVGQRPALIATLETPRGRVELR